jgi:hypothetical protein
MTMGPALLALAVFDQANGRLARAVATFGRVPLLYYVAHIYLIHLLAVASTWATTGDTAGLARRGQPPGRLSSLGFSLPGVYAIWVGVVITLFPLCRWYAALKQRRKDWWLSYL